MKSHDKYLGICMDHSTAELIEWNTNLLKDKTITSKLNHEAKELTLKKGEFQLHKREQHQNLEYYKDLAETIKNYNHVLLFGPTSAKLELYNLLKEDHLFAKIKIDIENTDKMTNKQQYAFVKDYFSTY